MIYLCFMRSTRICGARQSDHSLTRYGLPGDWAFWEKYDRAHLEVCSALAVLMLDGWKESKGVHSEISIVRGMGKPVLMIDPIKVDVRAENAPAAGTEALEVMG